MASPHTLPPSASAGGIGVDRGDHPQDLAPVGAHLRQIDRPAGEGVQGAVVGAGIDPPPPSDRADRPAPGSRRCPAVPRSRRSGRCRSRYLESSGRIDGLRTVRLLRPEEHQQRATAGGEGQSAAHAGQRPLTDDERDAVDDGQEALDQLLERLAEVPTPAGATPREIRYPGHRDPAPDHRSEPRSDESGCSCRGAGVSGRAWRRPERANS